MEEQQKLDLPGWVKSNLPSMVISELLQLPAVKQREFLEEFKRKYKSKMIAYVFWLFFGFHYAYLKNWNMQVIFSLTGGGCFIWYFIDLFRIPSMTSNCNKDIAIEIMRNLKVVSS